MKTRICTPFSFWETAQGQVNTGGAGKCQMAPQMPESLGPGYGVIWLWFLVLLHLSIALATCHHCSVSIFWFTRAGIMHQAWYQRLRKGTRWLYISLLWKLIGTQNLFFNVETAVSRKSESSIYASETCFTKYFFKISLCKKNEHIISTVGICRAIKN